MEKYVQATTVKHISGLCQVSADLLNFPVLWVFPVLLVSQLGGLLGSCMDYNAFLKYLILLTSIFNI